MQQTTKEYLTRKYNCIPRKTSATCLKYHYLYNNVHVNVYFDAYDVRSVSLSIVLVAENKYYYTPLNILSNGLKTEYLSDIPHEILNRILVNKHLDDFYETMEEHLLNDRGYINYYNEDRYFVNTIKFAKTKLDLPFWWHIRNVRMSDDTVNKLYARADITLDILLKIQKRGFTLVRTADPSKRKELTLILQQEGIELL